MNTPRLADLARRREALVERISIQRSLLVQRSAALVLPATLIERGISGALWIRDHPVVTGVAVTALVALRGKRLLSWARRSFILWKTGRALVSFLTRR